MWDCACCFARRAEDRDNNGRRVVRLREESLGAAAEMRVRPELQERRRQKQGRTQDWVRCLLWRLFWRYIRGELFFGARVRHS
jgi:hypothetical protein